MLQLPLVQFSCILLVVFQRNFIFHFQFEGSESLLLYVLPNFDLLLVLSALSFQNIVQGSLSWDKNSAKCHINWEETVVIRRLQYFQ